MPKHHLKTRHKGEGVKLVGSPEELINLLIPGDSERAWATDQIENEGPKHKQVLNAILSKRLFELISTVEKSTDTTFHLQNGYKLTTEKEGKNADLPVHIPINLPTKAEKKDVVDAITHAPEHVSLAYAMCLQVVEWVIDTTTAGNKPTKKETPLKNASKSKATPK